MRPPNFVGPGREFVGPRTRLPGLRLQEGVRRSLRPSKSANPKSNYLRSDHFDGGHGWAAIEALDRRGQSQAQFPRSRAAAASRRHPCDSITSVSPF
jgi:hypothetical protein